MPETFEIPNTLGVASRAAAGCAIQTLDQLVEMCRAELDFPLKVIGQGSNIVPKSRVECFVCTLNLRGKELLQDGSTPLLKVWAGESWHELVDFCVAHGFFGIENLALIPGQVGAAPIQNIGAYGVELADVVDRVGVVDEQGHHFELSATECEFGYRDSVFKRNRAWTVVYLVLRLHTEPRVNLSYKELADFCQERVAQPSPQDVFQAVVEIRSRKLPNPNEHPNVGSFFKNPIVDADVLTTLQGKLADLVVYDVPQGYKLSAAQLIDRAGWKGRPATSVECWHKQPLVIVNRGAQNADEVLRFADNIAQDIHQRYGVALEMEPEILA